MSTFERKAVSLTDNERALILRHAQGQIELKDQVHIIYKNNIAAHIDGGRVSDEMNYLSEVFNVCPCGIMKKMYRDRILNAAKQ